MFDMRSPCGLHPMRSQGPRSVTPPVRGMHGRTRGGAGDRKVKGRITLRRYRGVITFRQSAARRIGSILRNEGAEPEYNL